ncbi:MAG: hypothetical protein COY81_04420 [Candidatus Pacebacteria bacterium CG_4_10_14_0_8_um_filter_43_12]|nr:MAG: hypothetical protein COU66_04135 [Candidatus Pacebacteria bacterium CG10_big_fil_rev_8_21_14_0_10_44_11]PIY79130.1 MAG: hypothetical protein COY81_04420 [Candidatus Pacebacteria bacterium CG_4_10_14_0_8_um_filter_43_12]
MNILIVFSTYSGSTMSAAQVAQQVFEATGNQTALTPTLEAKPQDFNDADLIVIASPTWDYQGEEGQPHEDFVQAYQTFAGQTFPAKKFAILVLGDSNFSHFCGAADHLVKWVADLQGKLATETLKIDQYYFNEPENAAKVKTWAEKLAQSAD